ncbi:SRPBCC domain-containing protein [Aquimarina litoralis]|uniref:SRPBCC domain-containing protein n=1 Tax=Aquimarina litoralis TaxID=584605 RepID=UPI001C586145|nr:SRPBCC domain-containing protein [Aquimarina litoralis]MBW1297756.1 hypothetical protein [Aquimarina litoralis]
MPKNTLILFFLLHGLFVFSQNENLQKQRVLSSIDSTYSPELVLKQEFIVKVPLDSVWNAYTTKKGFESWATAIAEIDFKVNGTIKTNYNKKGIIGDENTITLHIINYVPKRMLTLQAEITKNFPQFMKEDEKDLYNTILFEEITATTTKVISYGIGYKHTPKYMSLMKFFIQGNEQSYLNLITYLETGKPSVNY